MAKKKTIATIIAYVLFFAVGAGLISLIVKQFKAPTGIYVEYEDMIYEEENDGAQFRYIETVSFTVKNADGWGLYKASDCTVKVLPNQTESLNFSYTVGKNETPMYYSRLSDVTAAFVASPSTYEGKGLPIDEYGNFELVLSKNYTMATALSRIHDGASVEVDSSVDVSKTPYFILQVTSPGGDTVVKIPFTLSVIEGKVTGVDVDTPYIYF